MEALESLDAKEALGDVRPLVTKASHAEAVSQAAASGKKATIREILEEHRKNPVCVSCHSRMDPLGFGLENFDAIGKWRDNYENGREIDMEGTLFRKHPFHNVIEFKDAILAEKDRFTKGLAGHLLSFALARELGPADQIALDQIVETTANDGDRIQSLLQAIILSEPFLASASPKSTPTSK